MTIREFREQSRRLTETLKPLMAERLAGKAAEFRWVVYDRHLEIFAAIVRFKNIPRPPDGHLEDIVGKTWFAQEFASDILSMDVLADILMADIDNSLRNPELLIQAAEAATKRIDPNNHEPED